MGAAELATLRTVELTIGGVGFTIKPMIGFGKSLDASKLLNTLIPVELVDEDNNNKPIDFEDQCEKLQKEAGGDQKWKETRKAKAALAAGKCAEPDRRSRMCKMCNELVGRSRPKRDDE